MSITDTVVETETHAMQRLLAKARVEGVKLGKDAEGRYWAASVSTPGVWYALTAVSCTCKGFAGHQRCKHLAALHAHLGWLKDEQPEPPTPTVVPVLEVQHTPGGWVDDDLTPSGMVRFAEARTSIVIGGVEEVRISGECKVSAVFRPGTANAADLIVCITHFDTVVHYVRMLDPEHVDQVLSAAEMFRADELLPETMELAAA
jgi:hypothetical protein